jgi:hypothetical protein
MVFHRAAAARILAVRRDEQERIRGLIADIYDSKEAGALEAEELLSALDEALALRA